jgi:hypothetical protein
MIFRSIAVDGDEKISLFPIGNGGTLVELQKTIVGPGPHNFHTGKTLLNQLTDLPRYDQRHVFFFSTVAPGPQVSGVFSAVSGINNNAVHQVVWSNGRTKTGEGQKKGEARHRRHADKAFHFWYF